MGDKKRKGRQEKEGEKRKERKKKNLSKTNKKYAVAAFPVNSINKLFICNILVWVQHLCFMLFFFSVFL